MIGALPHLRTRRQWLAWLLLPALLLRALIPTGFMPVAGQVARTLGSARARVSCLPVRLLRRRTAHRAVMHTMAAGTVGEFR